jgi:hypothetical protein
VYKAHNVPLCAAAKRRRRKKKTNRLSGIHPTVVVLRHLQ